MRRRALTATAALTLLLSLSAVPAAPADASAFGTPNRQPLDYLELVSWASSWFTGLWDGDSIPTDLTDPTNPTDPTDPTDPTETDDDRGTNLDPDG